MDVIIPNLVRVLFDPAIPTSSFNFILVIIIILSHFIHFALELAVGSACLLGDVTSYHISSKNLAHK